MATEIEHNLAVVSILADKLAEILRATPDVYGSNHQRDAEQLVRLSVRCTDDFEALIHERIVDAHILGDLGLSGPADQFVLYSDGVDMSAFETKPEAGES